jgi:D-alanyl-lipoteichoic acid acyltransferase DltB (MBOAT superfamily)
MRKECPDFALTGLADVRLSRPIVAGQNPGQVAFPRRCSNCSAAMASLLVLTSIFVTFFPQLIAGPIVHHAEVLPQFSQARDPSRRSQDIAVGWSIFCVGLFKKVIIADTCATYADAGYALLHSGRPLGLEIAWTSVLAYSFQLYFDFSGYSDMAAARRTPAPGSVPC